MSIGRRIRELRLEQGLTQTELGRLIGESKQTIYKYESIMSKRLAQELMSKRKEAKYGANANL